MKGNVELRRPLNTLKTILLLVIVMVWKPATCSTENQRSAIINYLTATEDVAAKATASKACQIANQTAAHINFMYFQEGPTSRIATHFYACMAELPLCTLQMTSTGFKEPQRFESSLSIFIMPHMSWLDCRAYVQNLIRNLNARQRLKNFHKYMFIWRGASPSQLRQLFHGIWSKHILQAIAVVDSRRVYTYEPFTAVGFTVRLCDDGFYFYDKIKNLHGQELRVSMFADFLRAHPQSSRTFQGYTGVDGYVASMIGRKLNATMRYIEPHDGQKYGSCRNGTFTGAVGDVGAGVTHIGFNARFSMDCMLQHIEQLYPFYRRLLFLVVPAAEMRPEYHIFVDAFDSKLWTLLFLNFGLVFVLFCMLQLLLRHFVAGYVSTKKFAHWYDIFELIFKSQFGEPVAGFARISSLRKFLIAWVLCSYVLSTVYFAKLESSFVHPVYEPNMDKLSELHRLDMPIYGVNNILDAVRDSLDAKYWQYMEPLLIRLPMSYAGHQYSLSMIRETKRIAFVLRGETARDLIAQSYDHKKNRPAFHIVGEYLSSMARSYIVTKGSPFLYKFQIYLSGLQESGILDFWLNTDLKHRASFEYSQLLGKARVSSSKEFASNVESFMEENAKKHVVLSLSILQGAFYLWIIGIGGSFAGFILEIIYWHFRQMKISVFIKKSLFSFVVI